MAALAKLIFTFLLVSMLAAMSTASGPWMNCRPGGGWPVYALPRCRAYVKHSCINGGGDKAPANLREECCRQLAAIDEPWCKCGALFSMLDSVYKELGVQQGQPEAFPGCRREALKLAAARVPQECHQQLPNGENNVCYWINYPDH